MPKKNPRLCAGFTLIELLVTMALTMLVVASMYSVFENSNKNYAIQEQVTEAENNLRAAIGLLGRELRMAGYDPTKISIDGIKAADETSIHFQADLDGDGTIKLNSNEDVKYVLDGADLKRNDQVVAENIHAIEFYYNDASTTPANLAEIRTITLSLLAVTAHPDRNFGSQTFTPASGVGLSTPKWVTPPGHRGRFMSATVYCRNMGL